MTAFPASITYNNLRDHSVNSEWSFFRITHNKATNIAFILLTL